MQKGIHSGCGRKHWLWKDDFPQPILSRDGQRRCPPRTCGQGWLIKKSFILKVSAFLLEGWINVQGNLFGRGKGFVESFCHVPAAAAIVAAPLVGKRNIIIWHEQNFSRNQTDHPVHDEETKRLFPWSWRNVNGHNLLAMMYDDPTRYSLLFQTYVQLTMLQRHNQPCTKSAKIMERSLLRIDICGHGLPLFFYLCIWTAASFEDEFTFRFSMW